MIEATTVAFMIGGTFLNRAHFDLIWHWMAVTTATLYVARRQLAQPGEFEVEAAKDTVAAPVVTDQRAPGRRAPSLPVWSQGAS